MWLNDLLPQKAEIRPTRPTSKNNVGRQQSLMAVAPSDTSDTSDTKKEKETLSGDFLHKEKEFAQVSSETPLSVRPDGNALSQKGDKEKQVGQAYGENAFPLEEAMPEQSAVKRRRCLCCSFWRVVPKSCWWVGTCAVTGGNVGFKTLCTLSGDAGRMLQ